MDSSKDSATGRIFSERLADKIPAPIPETSPAAPDHLTVDIQSAVRNGASSPSPALARTDGQTIEEITYSQRFALRTLPGMTPLISSLTIIY